MEPIQERLLRLWAKPPPEGDAALAAFGAVYSDPISLNGSEIPLEALVLRARILHAAFVDLHFEVLSSVEAPGRAALVFRLRGRHVGPLPTPLGDVPPTGRVVEVLTVDVLTIESDLVSELWVVADELGRLLQLDAVRRASEPPSWAESLPATPPGVSE
jgi:hypothetical protein